MSVFIDLDMTLTEERSIQVIDRELGLMGRTLEILKLPIPEEEKSRKIASILAGRRMDDVLSAARKTRMSPCSKEIIESFIKRGFEVNIVTLSYRQVAEAILSNMGFLNRVKIHAPILEVDESNKITGRVLIRSNIIETPWCIRCPVCKREVSRKMKREPSIGIGDSLPDLCMHFETDIFILIDRGNIPNGLERYATHISSDLCSAHAYLENILNGGARS
ncbi:MAG: haloacid dehalogenase-like hydrolase [Fervidicoccaceae archaeon]